MEKILITGISGRVGMKIASTLHKQYEIIGIDFQKPSSDEKIHDFFLIDLSSDESVKKGFDKIINKHGKEFHSVIHLAAFYSFKNNDFAPYQKITIDGTKRLLEALTNANPKQLIFSSTLLVYKPCNPGEKISEGSPVEPTWAYPKSKVITEKLITTFLRDYPAVILRIAGCYDEGCHSIPIAQQIKRIYEKSFKRHFYPGNLSSGAPYLHFDDLTDAIVQTINKQKEIADNEIFLLGEEETMSYEDLQDEISYLLWDHPCKTWKIPKPLAKLGAYLENAVPFIKDPFIQPWMIDLSDDYYALDISKAKNQLGWNPQKSLKKELPEIIKKLKEDPKIWYKSNKLNPPRYLK